MVAACLGVCLAVGITGGMLAIQPPQQHAAMTVACGRGCIDRFTMTLASSWSLCCVLAAGACRISITITG